MANKALVWAYGLEDEVSDIYEAFVLVTLADASDPHGLLWMRQSVLARRCRCSKRKVVSALKALEDRGLLMQLRRRRDNGSQRESAYFLVGWEGRERVAQLDDHPMVKALHLEGALSDDTIRVHVMHPVAECTPCMGGVHSVHGGGAQRAPLEPFLEPPKKPLPPKPPLKSRPAPEPVADVHPVRSRQHSKRERPTAGISSEAWDRALAEFVEGHP